MLSTEDLRETQRRVAWRNFMGPAAREERMSRSYGRAARDGTPKSPGARAATAEERNRNRSPRGRSLL